MSIKAYLLGVSSQPSFDGLKGCDDLGRVPELLDRAAVLLGEQRHGGAAAGVAGGAVVRWAGEKRARGSSNPPKSGARGMPGSQNSRILLKPTEAFFCCLLLKREGTGRFLS